MFLKLISLFAIIVAVNAGVIQNTDIQTVQIVGSLVADLSVPTFACVVVNAKIVLAFTPNQLLSNLNTLTQITASSTLLVLSDSFATISDVHTIIENATQLYGKPFIIYLTRVAVSVSASTAVVSPGSSIGLPGSPIGLPGLPIGSPVTAVGVSNNKCVYTEPVQSLSQGLGLLGLIYSFVRVITALEYVCDVAQFNILNDSFKNFSLIG